MKKATIILIVFLVCFGCKKEHSTEDANTSQKSFSLSDRVKKEIDAIQSSSQRITNAPDGREAHEKNDSITRKISTHSENIINILIASYGKVPTDTIFTVLKNIDHSGYIPLALYERLNDEDFSTEIGKSAKKAYLAYSEAKDAELGTLRNINLLDKKLLLNRIVENDTVLLQELLLKHEGYKVLDFWATWCAPCRSFNKRFQEHYLKYKDKGIAFYGIGIRVDSENEREKFLTAIANDKTPWEQFVDLNNATYDLFETNVVPYQVLLDKNNRVVKILSYDINTELDALLEN
ncbi:MAG: TlpA disulfide reductase family protein [Bacteroidota bacterium]